MTTIASRFALIHRNRFLKKSLNRFFIVCHSEALAEESCMLSKILPLHFIQCQNDTIMANKIIPGMRKISEFPKFKNRVKIRILVANARKNIF
jgi:hypothetical protein